MLGLKYRRDPGFIYYFRVWISYKDIVLVKGSSSYLKVMFFFLLGFITDNQEGSYQISLTFISEGSRCDVLVCPKTLSLG